MARPASRILILACAASIAALGYAPRAAEARRVVVDDAEFLDSNAFDPGCVIAAGNCTAYTLPFTVNFGSGDTTDLFVYENGVVSFGAQIDASTSAAATFDQYGVPVIAPLAFTTNALTSPFSVGVSESDSVQFDTVLNNGTGQFVIVAFDNDDSFEDLEDAVYLLLRKASNDDLLFEFIHGSCFCVFDNGENGPSLTGGSLGFSLGGQSFVKSDLTEADVEKTLSFRYAVSPGGIPEPSTWAMMIGGFGLIGAATRRGRRLQPAVLPG